MSQLRRNDVRALSKGDRHVMAHLGVVGVRLEVPDSSAWYWDPHTLELHEWMCQCRACRSAFWLGEPSPRCRFKRKYVAHQRLQGVTVDMLKQKKKYRSTAGGIRTRECEHRGL